VLERPLVLEEHDLAVHLAAQLEAHGDLRHRRVTHVRTVRVHAARAVGAADAEAALADRGEQGIAVAVLEELPALAGIPERLGGVGVLVRERRRGREREEQQRKDPACANVHDDSPWSLGWHPSVVTVHPHYPTRA